jgi:hypothetical protein
VEPDRARAAPSPYVKRSEQPPSDALAPSATVLLAAATAAAAAPGIALGVALAEALRRRQLAWTWALIPCAATAPVAALAGPSAAQRLATSAANALQGDGSIPSAVLAGAATWLLLTPWTALAWMLYRNRRDRLRGGAAERAVTDAIGPLQLHRIRHAHARETAAGPLTPDGVLLGTDHQGRPVRIPELTAHATIVGGSNSGKTNTAEVLLEAQAASGGGFVVLDGKGGRDLPRTALALGARYQRPVALWSIRPYGDAELDARRLPWNPVGDGDPTEIKDRIAASEDQTEPYYAAVAARGLLAAARAATQTSAPPSLDALANALEDPASLANTIEPAAPDEAGWLNSLVASEQSALRGMASRLRTMANSDGADALLPSTDGNEIRLHDAVRDGPLVVFTLPQGLYPALVPHVTRYVLQALNAVCTRIEAGGTKANAMVFVDELSAFDGDELCAGFERGRSAGVRFVVATQSLSNLASAGGDKLLHAALDNAELLVIHRQAVPDAAELLASIAGTEEAWEHTHKVSDAVGLRLGWDETGERNRRLTDRFKAHPNVIKRLRLGEAVVIAQRPEPRVVQLRVRAGLNARRSLNEPE